MKKLFVYAGVFISLMKGAVMACEFPVYENTLENSFISHVFPAPVGICGGMGPYFVVMTKTHKAQLFPQRDIAAFLNEDFYWISSDLLQTLEIAFRDVIEKRDDGRYDYKGRSSLSENKKFPLQYGEVMHRLICSLAPPLPLIPGDFSPQNAQLIGICEIGVTGVGHEKTILGTYGASACLILSIFNPHNQMVLLSHLTHGFSDVHLKPYLDKISSVKGQKLQAHIAGSQEHSRNIFRKLIKILYDRGDVDIVSMTPGCMGNKSKDLAINAATGEVFTSFVSSQLYEYNQDQIDLEVIMSRGIQFYKNPSDAKLIEIPIRLKTRK